MRNTTCRNDSAMPVATHACSTCSTCTAEPVTPTPNCSSSDSGGRRAHGRSSAHAGRTATATDTSAAHPLQATTTFSARKSRLTNQPSGPSAACTPAASSALKQRAPTSAEKRRLSCWVVGVASLWNRLRAAAMTTVGARSSKYHSAHVVSSATSASSKHRVMNIRCDRKVVTTWRTLSHSSAVSGPTRSGRPKLIEIAMMHATNATKSGDRATSPRSCSSSDATDPLWKSRLLARSRPVRAAPPA
mmetsp:Transcript_11272/g.36001  ORF Transcript_11272/g.36001 Transcript_11272/m.36001 type:complete len:246 (+) Transcript_11272:308-1045(+)